MSDLAFDCFLFGHLAECCPLDGAPRARRCAYCGSSWRLPEKREIHENAERLVEGNQEADEVHRGRLSAPEPWQLETWQLGFLRMMEAMDAISAAGGDPVLKWVIPRRGPARLAILDRRELAG